MGSEESAAQVDEITFPELSVKNQISAAVNDLWQIRNMTLQDYIKTIVATRTRPLIDYSVIFEPDFARGWAWQLWLSWKKGEVYWVLQSVDEDL